MSRVRGCLLLTLGLAGCLGPRADPSAFFLLSPVPPPAAEAPASVFVGVGPITIPAYLDRLQMVTRLSDNELAVSEIDRWAEPLEESIARTLEENLAALLPESSFVRFPWYASEAPDYAVSVELRRFEGDATGTVVLEARWSLSRGDAQIDERTARFEEAGGGPNRADQVAAQSRALAQLSAEIARALRGTAGR
jgi:uncharacterized lipoprotein YmbA